MDQARGVEACLTCGRESRLAARGSGDGVVAARKKVRRCPKTGKIRHKDAGDAAKRVWKGEHRGIYRCPYCKDFHITHLKQH